MFNAKRLAQALAVAGLIGTLGAAHAQTTINNGLVPGVFNLVQDESREAYVDANRNGLFDTGDVIFGYIRISNFSPAGLNSGNAVYGVFSQQITSTGPGGSINFGATTVAGLTLSALTGVAAPAGSIASFYDSAAGYSTDLITTLLVEFNWRPRTVGAFFVGLEQRRDFEDLVGRLLLRSDVCYAGRSYCLALARLNTPGALGFLQKYLGYYLTRTDLWFDQAAALAAVRHIDKVNGTVHSHAFDRLWNDFVSDKPNWNLDLTCARFDATMRNIESLRLSSVSAG